MLRITMPKQRIVAYIPLLPMRFPFRHRAMIPSGIEPELTPWVASSFRSTMGPWGDHGESNPDEQIHNLPFFR